MDEGLRRIVRKVCGAVDGAEARPLQRQEAERLFARILAGEGSEVQLAALFVGLRSRSTTGEELAGFATAARARIRFPELPPGTVVVATSRLGKRRYPLTALAALAAAAAAGVPVLIQAAPHAADAGVTVGDLWNRMVGELTCDADHATRMLRGFGLACWRPTGADPGWERLLAVENAIGLRSSPDVVSKLLAPEGCCLVVPARPGPVLGVASEAMAGLGHESALIVQGLEGSLDPSVRERTRGMILEDGVPFPLRLRPDDCALACLSEPQQDHEDRLEASVLACLRALTCTPGAAFHCAMFGAALILRVAGRSPDLGSALSAARDAFESGAAQHLLQTVARA